MRMLAELPLAADSPRSEGALMNQQPPVEIHYKGRITRMTLPHIHRMLRRGLRPIDYTMLALSADAHRITVADLMRQALESAGVR
jgi:hypothetical protein